MGFQVHPLLAGRLFALLALIPSFLTAQSTFLKDPDIVWAAEIEQDWVVDPPLENESEQGISTLKLLCRERNKLYSTPPALSPLVAYAASGGAFEIFEDAACTIPTHWQNIFVTTDNHTFDPETNEEIVRIACTDFEAQAFKAWRLRQVLTYYPNKAIWKSRVESIAPLIEIKNEDGDSIDTRPLFWFRPDNLQQKLTSNRIVWAKKTVNKQAKTHVSLTSFTPVKTTGGVTELLVEFQNVLEKKMKIRLYDVAEDRVLTPDERRSLLHRSDTFPYCFSEGPDGETVGIVSLELLHQVHYLRLVQTWYWDERRHRLSINLDAVAPLVDVLNNEGTLLFQRPLFYWRRR